MNEERAKILQMLSEGKITVEEAERLLDAIGAPVPPDIDMARARKRPEFLRIETEGKSPGAKAAGNVSIRVPLALLRAGVKFANLIPSEAREKINAKFAAKGIEFDMNNIRPENVDELIEALADLSIDINGNAKEDEGKVRIYCE